MSCAGVARQSPIYTRQKLCRVGVVRFSTWRMAKPHGSNLHNKAFLSCGFSAHGKINSGIKEILHLCHELFRHMKKTRKLKRKPSGPLVATTHHYQHPAGCRHAATTTHRQHHVIATTMATTTTCGKKREVEVDARERDIEIYVERT